MKSAYLRSALVLFLASCGGDLADFRPAKGASDMPAVKDAYRVKVVPPECTTLGYASAEGPSGLADIAQTAARHGANTFIIRNDDTDERVTTSDGNGLVTRTNHKLLAEVYRCPTSDDLPH
jgi:hypothetical protein